MKKVNKKIAVIMVITLLLIAAIVVAYIIMRKKQSQSGSTMTDTNDTTPTTLQYGSRGDEVKRLQEYLNVQLGIMVWRAYPTYNGQEIRKLTVDGIFGARTQAAVEWYFNSSTVQTNQF